MFKFDMHVHTSETSPCGRIDGAALVRMYKAAGYHGIVLTDHYYKEYFDSLSQRRWKDKIEQFLAGYRNARAEGEKFGLQVLLGAEFRFDENYNDYLIYGLTEEFLAENKELYNLGLKGFKEYIKGSDLLIYQAHPFRMWSEPADPSLLDGVEVYNGNARHNSRNHLAEAYAKQHGLLRSSGSDFHQVEDLGRGGILLDKPVKTSLELVRTLRRDKRIELLQGA